MSFPESGQVASHIHLGRNLARHHGPPFGPLPEGGDLFLPGHRERLGGLELLDEEPGPEVGAVGEGSRFRFFRWMEKISFRSAVDGRDGGRRVASPRSSPPVEGGNDLFG